MLNLRALCLYAKLMNRKLVRDREEFKKKELERLRGACALSCLEPKAYLMMSGQILRLGEEQIRKKQV